MNIIVQFVIIQTIVFGIVIFLLRKMTVGDTESAVNRLNQSYEDMNKKKEEVIARVQQIEQEYQKKKEEAEKVAAEVRDKAEQEMATKKDELLKRAREEAERTVSDAVSMKDKIRDDIRKEERLNLVDYCADLLHMILKDSVRDKVNEVLLGDFLKELEGMDMSAIPPSVQEVELVVSKSLENTEKEKISGIIQNKIKRAIVFKEIVDEKIIGGVVVKFGSLMLDSSIAGRLREHAAEKKHTIETST